MFGLHQVISRPTHTLSQSLSCINLIFTDQPHLVTDCGIHTSLHPNCHYQITNSKLNLKITYPPPYKCLVWDYKKGNSVCIKKALQTVNWNVLCHLKTLHEQVMFLMMMLSIFSQTLHIPNKIIDTLDE